MRLSAYLIFGLFCCISAGCQSTAPPKEEEGCDCCEEPATKPLTSMRGDQDDLTAAVLAKSDARTASLSQVLEGIDKAIAICETNMASIDTTAYRAQIATVGADGTPRLSTNVEQGALNDTKRDLDIGIQGDGFFKVKTLDSVGSGFAYTRNGNFFVNNKGEFVLGVGDGYTLEPSVMLPNNATEITVSQTGVIEYKQPGGTSPKQAGQITISRFINVQGLKLLGGGLYTETYASGAPTESSPGEDGAGITLQGFLEASNVSLPREQARIRFLQHWRDSIVRTMDARISR